VGKKVTERHQYKNPCHFPGEINLFNEMKCKGFLRFLNNKKKNIGGIINIK
jgi:hypothetical protein